MIESIFPPHPVLHTSAPLLFLPWHGFVTHLEKLLFFFHMKTLTCFGGEGWFAFICPFKIFYTPTICPNTLGALKRPCFCFLFWREACSVSAWGVFRHPETQTPHFFCIAQGVIHHFHFSFGSPTRVFKLARRKMMKSLPGREVFSRDVGRVEETREEEGLWEGLSLPFFLAFGSSGHLDANVVFTS